MSFDEASSAKRIYRRASEGVFSVKKKKRALKGEELIESLFRKKKGRRRKKERSRITKGEGRGVGFDLYRSRGVEALNVLYEATRRRRRRRRRQRSSEVAK